LAAMIGAAILIREQKPSQGASDQGASDQGEIDQEETEVPS